MLIQELRFATCFTGEGSADAAWTVGTWVMRRSHRSLGFSIRTNPRTTAV